MGVRKDKVQVHVEINGEKAGQTLKELKSSVRQLNRELDQLTPGTEEFNKKAAELRAARARMREVRSEINGVNENLDKTAKLGKAAGVAMIAAMVVSKVIEFGKQIADVAGKVFNMAANVETVQIKYRQVFGEAAGIVDEFARKSAVSFGLTRNEVKGLAADTGDLLIPMGFTRIEAAKMTVELVNTAGALAAWSNGQKSAGEASEILRKALLGERDGLKALGISISEAEIKSVLLEKKQSKLTGTLLAQAKAMATQELIMKKSADAQASFANNTETMSRKLAKVRAALTQLVENLIERFSPAISSALDWISKFSSGVSGYLEVRFSEKLTEEKASINILVNSILQHNEQNETRKALIDQLQAQYPGFLSNLDKETVSNAAIRDRLREVNKEYDKKIKLAAQEELVNDSLERNKEALKDIVTAQKDLNKYIAEMNSSRGAGIDISAPLEAQIQQARDFLRTNTKAGGSGNTFQDPTEFLDIRLKRITKSYAEYNRSLADINEDTQAFNQTLAELGMTANEVDGFLGKPPKSKFLADESAANEKAKKAEADRKAAAKAELARIKAEQEKAIADAKAAMNAIEDLKIKAIEDPFAEQMQSIITQTHRRIEALVGTPEQIAEQTALINAQMELDLEAVANSQKEHDQKLQQEKRDRQDAFLEDDLERMEQTQMTEEQLLALKFSKQIDAEEQYQLELYQLKTEALNARLELLRSEGKIESELALQIQSELLQNEIDFNKQRAADAKKTEDFKRTVQKEGMNFAGQMLEIGLAYLQTDEEARRKNANLIKAFSIGKIYADLAVEVGGYFATPDSVASLGTLGVVKAALATLRAGAAVISVQKQTFEAGGYIRNAGVADGPSHAGGGVNLVDNRNGRVIGEMEGGEPIMILSRNTRKNNGGVIDALMYNSMYRDGAPIFEKGGIITGTSPSNTSTSQEAAATVVSFDALVSEMQAIRQDFNNWNRNLKAFVTFDDLNESVEQRNRVVNNSNIS